MKVVFKVDTQNDFEIKEAKTLLENFLIENQKRELENKEKNAHFVERFNEWADRIIEEPFFGDQLLVSSLIGKFRNDFGIMGWSSKAFLIQLKLWSNSRKLNFVTLADSKYVMIDIDKN
jgi:hypothetical protein